MRPVSYTHLEQNEIEFLPVPVSQAADQLMIAKWVIRNLGYRYGYNVTFAPKITACLLYTSRTS